MLYLTVQFFPDIPCKATSDYPSSKILHGKEFVYGTYNKNHNYPKFSPPKNSNKSPTLFAYDLNCSKKCTVEIDRHTSQTPNQVIRHYILCQ